MCFGENIVQVREFWFSYFSSQRKLFWCDAFNDSNPDTDPDPDDQASRNPGTWNEKNTLFLK